MIDGIEKEFGNGLLKEKKIGGKKKKILNGEIMEIGKFEKRIMKMGGKEMKIILIKRKKIKNLNIKEKI